MGYTHSLPKEMSKRYADSEGNECPFCHMDGYLETIERAESGHEIKCTNCGRGWLECTKIVGVLLDKPYVKPLDDLMQDALKDAYRILHLIGAVDDSAHTHRTTLNNLFSILNRAGMQKAMALCNEYYTRLGDEDEDYGVVYELWEYAARVQRDKLMGFDL